MNIFRVMVGVASAMLSVCALASEPTDLPELPDLPPAAGPATTEPSKREVWVNVGGFSRHFARNKGYNESNLGLGVEYRVNPDVSVMAGSYHNSIRRTTTYATANWQPYHLGDFKVGASVGIMDGYPSIARGGTFFVAVPMVSYEGRRFGFNLGVIPDTGNIDGALILQLKIRAF